MDFTDHDKGDPHHERRSDAETVRRGYEAFDAS